MKNLTVDRLGGFTLIELLVVVLIIGILASVALPQYTKAVEKSRVTEAKTILKSIQTASRVYQLASGQAPTNFDELDLSFTDANGSTATGARFSTKDWTFSFYTCPNSNDSGATAERKTKRYYITYCEDTGFLCSGNMEGCKTAGFGKQISGNCLSGYCYQE